MIRFLFWTLLLTAACTGGLQAADPVNLGDLDGDGQPTVKDIVHLVNHLQGTSFLESNRIPFADVNRDTFVNTYDIESLTDIILERESFTTFPLLQVAQFSPIDGEEDVSLTREAIIRFSLPLAEGTVLTRDQFTGFFGGRELLSRVELSKDRLKASLFFQENLPASARVRVTFDGDGVMDYLGREIDPDGDGVAGGIKFIDFDTVAVSGVPGTAVEGHIYTAELGPNFYKVPLEGVIIEVIGAEQDIRTTTDANGYFKLENTPAGRFFVNVDGRQATSRPPEGFVPIASNYPAGNYYPFIAKPWFATAKKANNQVNGTGEIFLPLIRQGSLTTVSTVESTTVKFPDAVLNEEPSQGVPREYDPADLEEVSLTVPPNALFSNDGTRGGSVGIAPVVSDRLPEPLPPELNLPLVITVQTDGPTNFDVPVPVRFPNLPDPITGERLAPGEKSALWSFNHDTGDWEIAGPMTVTDDGLYVVTDAGTGIRQPGWHGTDRGTQGSGGGTGGGGGGDDDGGDDDDDTDDDECEETGSVIEGPWTCESPGSITAAGSFANQELTICAGDPISTPSITGTTLEDGEKQRELTDNFVCEDTPPPESPEIQTVPYSPEYKWLPEDPADFSTDRGGEYVFTCQVIGKGDNDCPDTAPQDVTGELKVTIIEIQDITFSPEEIPPDGQSTSQASSSVIPGDREIVWSIEGDSKGCSIDADTGLITAGTEAGSVTVRATEPESGCFVEASLCIGGDCCPDKSGTIRFGPLSARLPGNIVSTGEEGDFCIYSTPADVTVEMKGVFEKNGNLPGTTLSWKQHKSTGEFKDVTVSWEGELDLGKFGVITAMLTNASLQVDSSGDLSGDLTFNVRQTEDVSVGGIAVLKKDLTGEFSYSYMAGSAGFTGSWNFGGITGIVIELQKGGVVIGNITAQSFDSEGNINNARFTANAPGTYTAKNFTITLEELDLGMNYSIPKSEIDFLGGTGRIRLKDITNVKGEFTLELAFTDTNVTATVGAEEIEAFGCTLTGALSATVSYEFDLEGIEGTGISGKHNEFEQSFTNITFKIADGAVEEFTFGQIKTKYKGKIEFSFANGSYSRTSSTLKLDAMVALPTIELEVRSFAIDGDGMVSVGELRGSVDKSPVTFDIRITFGETEFRGDFSGQFAQKVSIRGEIIIGATETFNYGFFSLAVTTPGFPLGNSGLKIKSLAGEFGYNWEAPLEPGGQGRAVRNSLTIGFGLGISDVGDIALLEGYARLILGQANIIQLEGRVKVTANPPHIFEGQLAISYTLGSERVQGNLNSTVNVPPGSGSIVRLNSGSIDFAISASRFTVNGQNTTGQILDVVDINAGINISAPLSAAGSLSGRVFGRFDYEGQFNYVYPSGFNSANCDTADDTDTWYGFGIEGQLVIKLSGGLNASFNSNGFTGAIRAGVSGNSTMRVKWPCAICSNCVSIYTVSASGTVELIDNGTSTRIRGTVTFTAAGESETAEVDQII